MKPFGETLQGAKRLQTEFKYLNKQIAAGKITQVHDITPVDDNIFKWQVCSSALTLLKRVDTTRCPFRWQGTQSILSGLAAHKRWGCCFSWQPMCDVRRNACQTVPCGAEHVAAQYPKTRAARACSSSSRTLTTTARVRLLTRSAAPVLLLSPAARARKSSQAVSPTRKLRLFRTQ